MELKTRYGIGDTLWRLSNAKTRPFTVRYIAYDGTNVFYGTSPYDITPGSQCFLTKDELISYITADD